VTTCVRSRSLVGLREPVESARRGIPLRLFPRSDEWRLANAGVEPSSNPCRRNAGLPGLSKPFTLLSKFDRQVGSRATEER
jgi:hypothetical protein